MSDLSPQLEELVMAGRHASRPTADDFDRVLGLIQGQLAAPGSGGATAAPHQGSPTRLVAGKIIAATAASVALVIGGVALHGRNAELGSSEAQQRSPVPLLSQAPAVTPLLAAEVSPEPSAASLPAGPASNLAKAGGSSPSALQPSRGRDSLSEEVAILSRAETELHSGRAEAALKSLNEHERKFPRGILTEERIAARIQALCLLGRAVEANALSGRLRPGSLHGDGSRQACSPANASR
jgi:hypothetical protein